MSLYSKPAGLPVNNLEGFALAPNSTCVDGTKEVVWSDDGVYGAGPGSATEGHALYSGRINCDLGLGAQGVPKPDAWDTTKVYITGDKVSYNGKRLPGALVHLGRDPRQQQERRLVRDRDGSRRHARSGR